MLASLAEPGQLATVVERAGELLHKGDPEGGCQKVCCACLLVSATMAGTVCSTAPLVLP